MMLDFPNSPSDGQVYTFDNSTFVWNAAKGLWRLVAQNGVPVEIMEDALPATTSGWAVWGDIMVQWAYLTPGVSPQTIAFFAPFFKAGTTPCIVATPETSDIRLVSFPSVTHEEFTVKCVNGAGTDTPTPVRLIAFGEAPDAYKKPKIVQAVGQARFQEFHDPTNAASWRIVGNTLECWGKATSPANGETAVTFPKTFARSPIVNATMTRTPGVGTTSYSVSQGGGGASTTQTTFFVRDGSGNGVVQDFDWHAIGEWDGVS